MTSEIPYIYLFTREDMSKPQQIVQTAHAVHELNATYESGRKHTHHMVLFGATGERELLEIAKYLEEAGIHFHMFWEPDMNSYTSIATVPLRGKERTPMRIFNLMK